MSEEKLSYGLMSDKPLNTTDTSEIIEFRNELIFWSNRVAEIVKYYHSSLDSEQTKELVDLISAINKSKSVLYRDQDGPNSSKLKRTSSLTYTLTSSLSSSFKKRLSQTLHPAPSYPAPQAEVPPPLPEQNPIDSNVIVNKENKKDKKKTKKSKSKSKTKSKVTIDPIPTPIIVTPRSKKLEKTVSIPYFKPSVTADSEYSHTSNEDNKSSLGRMDTGDQVKLGLALIKAVKLIDNNEQPPIMTRSRSKSNASDRLIKSASSSRRHHHHTQVARRVERSNEFPTVFKEDFARMKRLAAQQQETINRLQLITSSK